MSIISIKNRTTSDPHQFERHKKSDKSFILSDTNQVEEFSIELTIGEQWANDVSREKAIMYAIEGDTLELPSLSSIVIETKETINVPFNMFGLVVQTGSIFLEQGVILGSGKVEPSFNGKLQILLFNTSKRSRTLKKGQKIGSAIFLRTENTLEYPIYNNTQAAVPKDRNTGQKLVKFANENWKSWLKAVAFVVTSSLGAMLLSPFYGELIKTTKEAQKTEKELTLKEIPATEKRK